MFYNTRNVIFFLIITMQHVVIKTSCSQTGPIPKIFETITQTIILPLTYRTNHVQPLISKCWLWHNVVYLVPHLCYFPSSKATKNHQYVIFDLLTCICTMMPSPAEAHCHPSIMFLGGTVHPGSSRRHMIVSMYLCVAWEIKGVGKSCLH